MSGPPVVLKCALSGESPPTDPVVTPSGFLCSRRLLLSKLSENGGVDPFDSSSTPRTLDESALVDLRTGPSAAGADVMPPRLPAAASLPSLLDQIQASHDAVLLELYEARSALEETRRELSQALYQNDAAVRVVARLAMERDGAREQLAAASARFDSTAASATENGGGTKKRFREGEDAGAVTGADGGEGPAPKRAMVDEANCDKGKSDGSGAEGSKGNIPKADFDVMFSVWEKLNNTRKKSKKSKKGNAGGEAGANATVTLDAVRTYKKMKQKSLHKSSVKAGVLDLAYAPGIDLLVTGGRDKQTVLYSVAEGKIVATLQPGTKVDVGAVDVQPDGEGGATVATGSPDGLVFAYTVPAAGSGGSCTQAGSVDVDDGSPIVGVSVHQSAKYVVAATRSGKIGILALREGGDLELVALFSGDAAAASEYTCGGLHADGLIYAAGTADGDIVVWDLNSQTVASTMKAHGGEAITSLVHSENGYHFASATKSGTVQVWDLRKMKLLTTLNEGGAEVGSVGSVAFSPSEGKLIAYGGANGSFTVVAVKDWDNKESFKVPSSKGVSGLAWLDGGAAIATCSDAERPVRFWGAPAEE